MAAQNGSGFPFPTQLRRFHPQRFSGTAPPLPNLQHAWHALASDSITPMVARPFPVTY